jgi:hypothetical protein
MSVSHVPAMVAPAASGAQRVRIYTWGAPTAVTNPGNQQGNTPEPVTDLNGTVVNPNTWTALATTDTCVPVYEPAMTDKCIHVTGTAGSGGSIALTGSNDGTNFVTLQDVFGDALSAMSPGTIAQINQDTAWIKPVVNSGDGTTALNVIISGKLPF